MLYSSHRPICYCCFVSDSDSIFQVRCEAHFVFRNVSCWGIVDWMRTKHCHDHNESILIGYNRVPNCPVFQGSCVPCLLCIMFLLCTIAFKCVPCSPGKKLSPPCVAVEDQPGNRRASLTLSQSSSNLGQACPWLSLAQSPSCNPPSGTVVWQIQDKFGQMRLLQMPKRADIMAPICETILKQSQSHRLSQNMLHNMQRTGTF